MGKQYLFAWPGISERLAGCGLHIFATVLTKDPFPFPEMKWNDSSNTQSVEKTRTKNAVVWKLLIGNNSFLCLLAHFLLVPAAYLRTIPERLWLQLSLCCCCWTELKLPRGCGHLCSFLFLGNDTGSYRAVFPEDRVVPVGSNMTFCCVWKEGEHLDYLTYDIQVLNYTRLSNWSVSGHVQNAIPGGSGRNVVCRLDGIKYEGSVLFAGCKYINFRNGRFSSDSCK